MPGLGCILLSFALATFTHESSVQAIVYYRTWKFPSNITQQFNINHHR